MTYKRQPNETPEEFLARVRAGSDAYFAEQGRAEAAEIFSDSPAEAEAIFDAWSSIVGHMSAGGDRIKIEAGLATLAKLLGKFNAAGV